MWRTSLANSNDLYRSTIAVDENELGLLAMLDEESSENVTNNLNESNLEEEDNDHNDTLRDKQNLSQNESNDLRNNELNTLIDQSIPLYQKTGLKSLQMNILD